MAEGKKYSFPLLSDPKKDRVVKEIPPPPHKPLPREALFPAGKPVNWKLLKEHFFLGGYISIDDAKTLIKQARDIFKKEPNILSLNDPVTVVGDIHGQFYDFVKILEVGGDISSINFLFLGDYVDRGCFGFEIVMTLFAIKINYPKSVVMLRGNHESAQMTEFFNFKEECERKYGLEIYKLIIESFYCLPIACIVNKKFLALHGGFSPDLKVLDDLRKLNRNMETPKEGLLCDILWSDPIDDDKGECDPPMKPNNVRSCSYFFGKKALGPFLKKNNLLAIIRAHESLPDGYKMHRWNGPSDFPMVITVFSAPNYCDVYGNKGAIIKFENGSLNIQQYNAAKHPYHLPNFMDVFSWSIPYVCSKVIEMMISICKKGVTDEGEEEIKDAPSLNMPNKREVLRNKVLAMSRMMKMYRVLTENNAVIEELKGLCPDKRIPRGLLMEGADALRDAVGTYQRAKKWDQVNEKRPGK